MLVMFKDATLLIDATLLMVIELYEVISFSFFEGNIYFNVLKL